MQNAKLRKCLEKFFLVFTLFFSFELLPYVARADGIKGYVELKFNQNDSKTETSGDITRTKSDSFDQLYNLNLTRTIYPNLTLRANGIFEKTITKLKADDLDTETSTTKIRPLIELNLRTPLFNAGAGYNRNERKDSSTGAPGVTNVLEDYNANFGWRPEDFPSLEMRLERTNVFDTKRLIQDIETDSVILNLRYASVKDLELRYQPSYRNTKDKLNNLDTKSMTHIGRATYSATFFDKRVSFLTSYNISHSDTKIINTGTTGEVSQQLFPVSGLSALDDNPVHDTLALNSALIDGDLTAGAGINIGLPPPAGNTSPRNMGLDFFSPTEVNALFVWVDRELPGQIASSFSWDIYTSSDNQNWTLLTTIAPAAFGLFQNRFEINFSNVTTRYIKVVTAPLKFAAAIGVPGDFSNIFVTEVQAFLRTPSSEVKNKRTSKTTTHLFEADTKTRILDVPSLYYEASYFLTKTSSLTSSTLSNGLSVNHRFSSAFSGSARVAREDIFKKEEGGVNYLYNASMTFVPLKTLSNTLTFSGRTVKTDSGSSDLNSISLNVIAEIYNGINLNVNEGMSFQTQETGEKLKSTVVIFGSSIIPHPKLNLNFNYSRNKTDKSGGPEKSSTLNSTADASVSYRPFETLYLTVAVSRIISDKTRNLQNYAVTWSPFREGALQFSLAFNESLTSDEGINREAGLNVRWNINRNTSLDMSYQVFKVESQSQTTNTKISGATFRMVF